MSGALNTGTFPWSEQALAELKLRHERGESMSHMAAELSAKYGAKLTKSAVCGKVHRLQLKRGPDFVEQSNQLAAARIRAATAKKRAAAERNSRVTEREAARLSKLARLQNDEVVKHLAPQEPRSTKLHPDALSITPKTIMELGNHCCRWPLHLTAPDGETMFCGNDRGDERPYCAAHKKRAFQRTRSAEEIEADRVRAESANKTLASQGLRFGWGGVKRVAA